MNDEHTERRYLLYFLLGWGLPALVIIVLVIVLLGGFGWTIHSVYGLVQGDVWVWHCKTSMHTKEWKERPEANMICFHKSNECVFFKNQSDSVVVTSASFPRVAKFPFRLEVSKQKTPEQVTSCEEVVCPINWMTECIFPHLSKLKSVCLWAKNNEVPYVYRASESQNNKMRWVRCWWDHFGP